MSIHRVDAFGVPSMYRSRLTNASSSSCRFFRASSAAARTQPRSRSDTVRSAKPLGPPSTRTPPSGAGPITLRAWPPASSNPPFAPEASRIRAARASAAVTSGSESRRDAVLPEPSAFHESASRAPGPPRGPRLPSSADAAVAPAASGDVRARTKAVSPGRRATGSRAVGGDEGAVLLDEEEEVPADVPVSGGSWRPKAAASAASGNQSAHRRARGPPGGSISAWTAIGTRLLGGLEVGDVRVVGAKQPAASSRTIRFSWYAPSPPDPAVSTRATFRVAWRFFRASPRAHRSTTQSPSRIGVGAAVHRGAAARGRRRGGRRVFEMGSATVSPAESGPTPRRRRTSRGGRRPRRRAATDRR